MKQTMVFVRRESVQQHVLFPVGSLQEWYYHTYHDFAWRQFKDNNIRYISVLLFQLKSSETWTYIRHQTSILFINFVNLSNVILLMEEIRKHHLGCSKNLVDNGINYQPQLVSRISEPPTVDTPFLRKKPKQLSHRRNVWVNKNSLWWSSERQGSRKNTSMRQLHPQKMKIEPENDSWKMIFLPLGCILRFPVNLPGCSCLFFVFLFWSSFRGG